ncbi:MAG: SCO family protein [Nitrospinae bacterium]|nr:SCO family protein [Nitrospinota bacterium]
MKKVLITLIAVCLAGTAFAGEHEGHGEHGNYQHQEPPEIPLGPKEKLIQKFRKPDAKLVKKGYFLNQNGEKATLADYRGKIVLLDFTYSGCPHGLCQYLNQKMQYVARKYAARLGIDIQLVSVSFDDTDNPEKLKKFSERFEVTDVKKWAYLGGAAGDIKEIATEYGVSFEWKPGDEAFVHTARTVLLDREGKKVNAYRGTDYKLQQVTDDIETLLKGNK